MEKNNEGFMKTDIAVNVHHWHDFDKNNTNRGPHIPYAYANNPAPGQFDAAKMSKGMVSGYKPFVVVDGEGVRCSVYLSGCMFHCLNCFSPMTWRFNAGFPYTQEFEDTVIRDLSQPYVQGLTLIGGEPMANTPTAIKLSKRFRKEFGNDKDIWCWTGFTWEELHRKGETPDKLELLEYVDILVDGRFMEDYKDPFLQFRGSSNQRIIDVKRSTKDSIHIWDKLNDQKNSYKEFNANQRSDIEGIQS
jgi:anaerobic ribonucleoside-triphosphate reductase activating protein